jgi:signal transduction histidine kinase
VLASAEALWEVFYNLTTNSLDALPEGGTIRIERLEQASQPGMLRLQVTDDGPGVPAALVSRIFDPYVTGREGGHGLGLATVKRRVDELGGSVNLVATESGATFELCLPTESAS